jgi:hypothetical protein
MYLYSKKIDEQNYDDSLLSNFIDYNSIAALMRDGDDIITVSATGGVQSLTIVKASSKEDLLKKLCVFNDFFKTLRTQKTPENFFNLPEWFFSVSVSAVAANKQENKENTEGDLFIAIRMSLIPASVELIDSGRSFNDRMIESGKKTIKDIKNTTDESAIFKKIGVLVPELKGRVKFVLSKLPVTKNDLIIPRSERQALQYYTKLWRPGSKNDSTEESKESLEAGEVREALANGLDQAISYRNFFYLDDGIYMPFYLTEGLTNLPKIPALETDFDDSSSVTVGYVYEQGNDGSVVSVHYGVAWKYCPSNHELTKSIGSFEEHKNMKLTTSDYIKKLYSVFIGSNLVGGWRVFDADIERQFPRMLTLSSPWLMFPLFLSEERSK